MTHLRQAFSRQVKPANISKVRRLISANGSEGRLACVGLIATKGQVIVVLVDGALLQVSDIIRAIVHVFHVARGSRNIRVDLNTAICRRRDAARGHRTKMGLQPAKTGSALECLAGTTARVVVAAQKIAGVIHRTKGCGNALLHVVAS